MKMTRPILPDRHSMEIMRMYFTRNRFMPVNTRWYFCMVTENLQKRGKPHPTGVKDFKISFYGWDSVFIWLISLVGEKPGEV